MAVSVITSPALSPGAAQPLFEDGPAIEGRGASMTLPPTGSASWWSKRSGTPTQARPFM